jgi:hypothetical protein
MRAIRFTWDDRKAAENARKHRVSFSEAATVFFDENARLSHDPEHSLGEERFVLLGLSSRLRILTVCHTCRGSDREIRLISARKATQTELRQYGSFL